MSYLAVVVLDEDPGLFRSCEYAVTEADELKLIEYRVNTASAEGLKTFRSRREAKHYANSLISKMRDEMPDFGIEVMRIDSKKISRR